MIKYLRKIKPFKSTRKLNILMNPWGRGLLLLIVIIQLITKANLIITVKLILEFNLINVIFKLIFSPRKAVLFKISNQFQLKRVNTNVKFVRKCLPNVVVYFNMLKMFMIRLNRLFVLNVIQLLLGVFTSKLTWEIIQKRNRFNASIITKR